MLYVTYYMLDDSRFRNVIDSAVEEGLKAHGLNYSSLRSGEDRDLDDKLLAAAVTAVYEDPYLPQTV